MPSLDVPSPPSLCSSSTTLDLEEHAALLSEKHDEESPRASSTARRELDVPTWLVLDVQEPTNLLHINRPPAHDRTWLLKSTLIHLLLPSFLHPTRFGGEAAKDAKISPTAYLDGLRGVASFIVYIRHFASATHANIQSGYGASEADRSLLQLPFLRLLFAGPAMVSLFFIVSGFALSWAPLRAAASAEGGGDAKMLRRLSSSVFRRAIRLFLPGVVSTFLVVVCIRLRLYARGHAAVNDRDMPGFHEPEPPQLIADPLAVQLRDWVMCTWHWVNIWSPGDHPYDVHLWTLPVEFRCSMVLFMTLVGVARAGPRIRLLALVASVVYCHLSDSWAGWLFFAGAAMAQWKLMRGDEDEEQDLCLGGLPRPKSKRWFWRMDVVRCLTFGAGLYLLSAPDGGFASSAPGYIFISARNPPSWPENWRFPHCAGALLTVWALDTTRTRLLRALFTNPVAIYLGKISYALYLVHGPLVHMLGFWLVPWFWDAVFGRETALGREAGFAVAFLLLTVLLIWCSDLFWRAVDQKCVSLAKWVEEMAVNCERPKLTITAAIGETGEQRN